MKPDVSLNADARETSARLDIRYARLDDVAALVEMARNAFRDTYRGIDDPQAIEDYVLTELTPAYFAAQIDAPCARLILATRAGELLGYALVAQSNPPPCVRANVAVELARIYLREDAKGKGYGALLMRAVQAEARRFGADAIWLGVYERNVPAREFYQRYGFIDVGTKDFLFGGRVYADPVMCGPVPRDAWLLCRPINFCARLTWRKAGRMSWKNGTTSFCLLERLA